MPVLFNEFNEIKLKSYSGAYIIFSIRITSLFGIKSFITFSPIISIINLFVTKNYRLIDLISTNKWF